ncbi:MAG: hypothetical protein ACXWU1_06260, partial [Allosphingosinicella sp.]
MPPIPKFNGTCFVNEMIEFGSFPKGTQRYIRRALDIALGRNDAQCRWSRGATESEIIAAQASVYSRLAEMRALVPDDY